MTSGNQNRRWSRKGTLDVYPIIIALMGIALIVVIVGVLAFRYADLEDQNARGIGARAFDVFNTYQKADTALIYADSAARQSLEKAAFTLAGRGLLPEPGAFVCGKSPADSNYNTWLQDVVLDTVCVPQPVSCVPDIVNAMNDAKNLFIPEFESAIDLYTCPTDDRDCTRPDLPKGDYEHLLIRQGAGSTEAIRTAELPVTVNERNVEYSVLPSFREEIDFDLFGSGQEIIASAQSLRALDETAFNSQLAALSAGNLKWLGTYSEQCGLACNTGETCEKCVEFDGDGNCVETQTVQIKKTYCIVTALVDVKVMDPVYGEKKTIINGDAQPYTFRFALSWAPEDKFETVDCS